MVGRKPTVAVKALTPCVLLISSEGHEFIVKREHAFTLGSLKAMLRGPGKFAENEVSFREIPLHVLSKVCTYFTYKVAMLRAPPRFPNSRRHPKLHWNC